MPDEELLRDPEELLLDTELLCDPEELLLETEPLLCDAEELPLETEPLLCEAEELRLPAELLVDVEPTVVRLTLLAPDLEVRTDEPEYDLPAAEDAALARGTDTEEERAAPMPLEEPPAAPPLEEKLPSRWPRASALEKPL